jgi:hypothetical protein
MFPRLFIWIDPLTLYLPQSRRDGPDLFKYQMQVARFGASMVGMPPPVCYRGIDGTIVIREGVTRAARVAKLLPGTLLQIEIDDDKSKSYANYTMLKDKLP